MEKDIGKISKNDTTDIIVRVDDFGGNTGLTIREFVTSDRYTGFTKSGVRILARDFQKFKEMIDSIPESDMNASGSEGSPKKSDYSSRDAERKTPAAKKKVSEELPDY
ncbi:hypothetical protein HY449_00605 [Candidatus Pacearchaeota archaeon]|nr:hypothetical protein [Candidatus Pacearchaeota archaeon]